MPGRLEASDLTQAVNAVITVFAAFVGISLTDFFDEAKNGLDGYVRVCAFVAVVALLLRYILGSAVHLNRAYGARRHPEGALLPSVGLFIKDLLFLVAFGYVAIRITHSHKFVHFAQQAAWFVGLGFLWSISDRGFRWLFLRSAAGNADLNRLSLIWAAIDGAQLLLTGLIVAGLGTHLAGAVALAVLYLVIFSVDIAVLLR